MKAIYQGKLYTTIESDDRCIYLQTDTGEDLKVLWADPSLVVDPTDGEVDGVEYA